MYFNFLEIEHLGIAAKERNIKKAYRKKALQYHPDKNPEFEFLPEEEKEEKKELWLKI